MGKTPETARLQELNAQGIPGLKALSTGLDAFTATIGDPSAQAVDSSLSDRFWANAQKLVTFRSTGPREGDDPLAILSRVKAGVANGQLSDAKAEWMKLPKEIQDGGSKWASQLEIRLEAQSLYQTITDKLSAAAG